LLQEKNRNNNSSDYSKEREKVVATLVATIKRENYSNSSYYNRKKELQ
jgi:hypothetical protein